MRTRKGFTLVELLVVIATVAILVAILVPTVTRLLEYAKRVQCASNMRSIGIAWKLYTQDNNGALVHSNTRDNRMQNGQYCWVEWGRWSQAAGEAAIKRGQLWPYVNSLKAYKCSNPVWPWASSYSMSAKLNGERSTAHTIAMIPQAANTFLLMEEDDWRGINMNSWGINNANTWWDYVAGNHNHGDNVVFADGHIQYYHWKDPDTLTLSYGNFGKPDPGSVDLALIWSWYKP